MHSLLVAVAVAEQTEPAVAVVAAHSHVMESQSPQEMSFPFVLAPAVSAGRGQLVDSQRVEQLRGFLAQTRNLPPQMVAPALQPTDPDKQLVQAVLLLQDFRVAPVELAPHLKAPAVQDEQGLSTTSPDQPCNTVAAVAVVHSTRDLLHTQFHLAQAAVAMAVVH